MSNLKQCWQSKTLYLTEYKMQKITIYQQCPLIVMLSLLLAELPNLKDVTLYHRWPSFLGAECWPGSCGRHSQESQLIQLTQPQNKRVSTKGKPPFMKHQLSLINRSSRLSFAKGLWRLRITCLLVTWLWVPFRWSYLLTSLPHKDIWGHISEDIWATWRPETSWIKEFKICGTKED